MDALRFTHIRLLRPYHPRAAAGSCHVTCLICNLLHPPGQLAPCTYETKYMYMYMCAQWQATASVPGTGVGTCPEQRTLILRLAPRVAPLLLSLASASHVIRLSSVICLEPRDLPRRFLPYTAHVARLQSAALRGSTTCCHTLLLAGPRDGGRLPTLLLNAHDLPLSSSSLLPLPASSSSSSSLLWSLLSSSFGR